MAVAAALLACGGSQRVDEDKSQNRLAIAQDYYERGELEGAVKEATRALTLNPSNHLARNLLGLVEVTQARQLKMILEYDDCLTGADAVGLIKKQDEHLLAARQQFEQAIALDGSYGEAYHGRATVDLALGDYTDAVAGFKEALANAGPGRLVNASLTRANLGWAFFLQGDNVDAALELRQAIRFQPGMCLAHYRLGRVYFARGEWEKALQEFELVLAQPEVCVIQEAYLYAMKTYLKQGLAASVPKAGQACIALAPRSCVAAECRSLMP